MADVHWLSEREQEIWRAYTTASREFSAHLDRQLRRDADIPTAYYEILVTLSEAPGRAMRMSRLADALNSSRSRLSHAMAVLEKAGWVSRCAADTDLRGSVARLTDTGFTALAAAAPGHVMEVRKHLFDVLSPEQQDALHEISRAIRDGLRPTCEAVRAEENGGDNDAGPK